VDLVAALGLGTEGQKQLAGGRRLTARNAVGTPASYGGEGLRAMLNKSSASLSRALTPV